MKRITGNSSKADDGEQTKQASTTIVKTSTILNFIAPRSYQCAFRVVKRQATTENNHTADLPPTIGSSLGCNRSTASGLE